MRAVEILRAAWALIDTPEKWCKGHSALRSDGYAVSWRSGDACSFCADGALARATVPSGVGRLGDAFEDAAAVLRRPLGASFTAHIKFNDEPTTTHADMEALFKRAIELAEAST